MWNLKYFLASVFTNENNDDIHNFTYKNEKKKKNSLNTCIASELDIEKSLSNLNPNKSPWPDNLHP